jgi:methyl-accepting chemotaxis protein
MDTVEETIAGFNRIYSVLRVQQSFADTMKGTMLNITDRIKSINSVTNEAKEVTEELQQSAAVISSSTKELLKSISGIEEGSKEIQDIVSLISNIAEQTNMLAMNASIEAAHAGSSGKGFGVVADEIRTLAENSTSQAKEIRKVLKDIIKRIFDAVEISKRNEINTIKITETVDKVYNTNIEVSKMVDQQIESMKSIEKEISSSLEVTNEVSDYSKEQNKKINQFKEEINVLIEKMKNVKMAMNQEVKESENTINIIISMKDVRKENMIIRTKLEDSINKFKVDTDRFEKEISDENDIDLENILIEKKSNN